MDNPGYPDLHAHIAALHKNGLLVRVQRPINKDTEMHALVRWQFRGGLAESQRRAFLFENVTDAEARKELQRLKQEAKKADVQKPEGKDSSDAKGQPAGGPSAAKPEMSGASK